MIARKRRVVKRALKRETATRVRRRIEQAQSVASRSNGVGTLERARAQRILDEYGVSASDNVTQSRHRFRGWWRVFSEPMAR